LRDQAAFAEKVALAKHCDDRFPPLLGDHGDLDLARPSAEMAEKSPRFSYVLLNWTQAFFEMIDPLSVFPMLSAVGRRTHLIGLHEISFGTLLSRVPEIAI
jgi:hypothetical protein